MSKQTPFSSDYAAARERFRRVASRLGWQAEAHPIGTAGPTGEELTIDVAYSRNGDPGKVLVVSSGVHGVEGFFGSAVQVALLERWASLTPPSIKCVLLHGLNPFGFAWLRRFDENNVDPNRNFLLEGERFEGAPESYARLDAFLNPRQPPSSWEPFTLKAMWLIARHGMPALRRAVAAGQYDFPRGLFFGGAGPSRMHQLLAENLGRWLRGSKYVVHLDFHTGLGVKGAWKLLIDYPLNGRQRTWLTDWFGGSSFEGCDSSSIAYDARGGLGRWCVSRKLAPDYLFACAEFGTYGPIPVLGGLRAENQAHHWGTPSAASTVLAKQRLKELFCPSAEAWRSQVLEQSLELVGRALRGLLDLSRSDSGAAEPDAALDQRGMTAFRGSNSSPAPPAAELSHSAFNMMMDDDYQLLTIRQHGDVMIAVLPVSKMLGHDLSQTLREDFQRLVRHASCSIVLDLRQVEFIDGLFFTRILEFWRCLKERSIGLTVQVSPSVAEVARITKLDQLLDISRTENSS